MELKNLPEVNFASETLQEIIDRNVKEYEQIIYEETGEQITLYPGHPKRTEVQMLSLVEFQLNLVINERAKQNLLRYATGSMVQHIGARSGTDIILSIKAETMIKLVLTKVFEIDYVIQPGTLFTPGNNVYFETDEIHTIMPGQTEIEFKVLCTAAGTVGNDFLPGQINIAATSLLFVESIENTIKSFGGTELEDEENYKERIRIAPSTYNTAGSDTAYIAMAKKFSPEVSDVYVYSSAPSVSDIVFLLSSGIPNADQIEAMRVYLSDKSIRPTTDLVQVAGPTSSNYSLEYSYYISTEDALVEGDIKTKIAEAEAAYKVWQSSSIGKSINPSKLHDLIMQAGASRVEIVSPGYGVIQKTEIPVCAETTATYGGLENDGS